MRKINKKMQLLVFCLILLIGVGYAAISTTLTITGNSSISGDSSNFQNNVFFESASLTSAVLKSADVSKAQPVINGNTMNFSIPTTSSLKVVGDKIEVDYTIRNESNYKALVAVPVVESNNSNFLDYFTVTHSRSNNLELDVNTTSVSQKLTLTLKQTYSEYDAKQFMFTVKINATAVESSKAGLNSNSGVPVPSSFANDSWETISNAVKSGNTSAYNVGDTKDVDLGSLGVHKVRIVNMSTPVECSDETFSQTACGFVVEFTDVISEHEFFDNNYTTGSWPASSMRTYLNTDVYNAMTSDLKNVIVNTRVVSGHNRSETSNFTSTDKLYIPAVNEIYTRTKYDYNSSEDSLYSNTRKFDYYVNGVSNIKYLKKDYDIAYATRSINVSNSNSFIFIVDAVGDMVWKNNTRYAPYSIFVCSVGESQPDSETGDKTSNEKCTGNISSALMWNSNANKPYGVSPAFRLG